MRLGVILGKKFTTAMELLDNHRCFVCGKENPRGLHLDFVHAPGHLETTLKTEEWMQGYVGIVHGGIISTVLDESMVKLLFMEGHKAVTAELNIKLLQPVPPGTKLTVKSSIVAQRGRIVKTEAEATSEDGTPVAHATATCVIVG
jgi:uncharacterized protein (TIGR00369 family)